MSDSKAGSSQANIAKPRWRNKRLTSAELREAVKHLSDEEPFVASDEDEYIPQLLSGGESEESDIEKEPVVEQEYTDSDENVDEEEAPTKTTWAGKDGTQWSDTSSSSIQRQTIGRNILHEKSGASSFSRSYTAREIFKSIISPEMCTLILRHSNKKGRKVTDEWNRKLADKYPPPNTPSPKVFIPFTEVELDAFLGVLIAAGVHRSNREHVSEMWKLESLPLFRAAMSRDRFKMFLRFIRFDDQNTRAERAKNDKAAPIRDIWTMLNSNLAKNYKPKECITVDEQLFPYRAHTKFTQYIPSKPAKYGIKIFWSCDAANAYPLQGQLYTGKPLDGERQVNVGERTVLDLVAKYKGSGRNVTTDNFFTSLQLARTLNSWKMTLVGILRKNKAFLPPNMQASKDRPIYSTIFAFNKDATICSYVPKKNKSVILLSTMHTTGQVDDTTVAKPEIIKYFNQTKGGVDTMDKMLGEYTVKRRTNRWPLAFFFNTIDVGGLASYCIYKEHNPNFRTTDQRRRFLKDLAHDMCLPAIQMRSLIPKVVGNYFTRQSLEMVLCRQIIEPIVTPAGEQPRRDASGRVMVVGSCQICRELKLKQRKTRKACKSCCKPVCNEHSVDQTICKKCCQKNN